MLLVGANNKCSIFYHLFPERDIRFRLNDDGRKRFHAENIHQQALVADGYIAFSVLVRAKAAQSRVDSKHCRDGYPVDLQNGAKVTSTTLWRVFFEEVEFVWIPRKKGSYDSPGQGRDECGGYFENTLAMDPAKDRGSQCLRAEAVFPQSRLHQSRLGWGDPTSGNRGTAASPFKSDGDFSLISSNFDLGNP